MQIPNRNPKVLVADDDRLTLRLMSRIFRDEGYWVKSAEDGKQALEMIRQDPPDVLFTDLIMPKISGEEVIRYIRSDDELSKMLIVVVSGALREYPDFENLNADFYIEKCDIQTLRKKVKEMRCMFSGKQRLPVPKLSLEKSFKQRKIVEELLDNRFRIQQILDNLQEGLIVYDFDRKILGVNPATERCLKKTSNEMLGTFVETHFDPLDQGKIKTAIEEIGSHAHQKNRLTVFIGSNIYELTFSDFRQSSSAGRYGGLLLIHELTRQKEAETQLEKRVHELNVLHEVAQLLNSSLSEDVVFNALLKMSVELLDAEAGTIALMRQEKDDHADLDLQYVYGDTADEIRGLRISAKSGLIGWVVTNDQPVIVDEANDNSRFPAAIDGKTDLQTRSIICYPIKLDDRMIGAIEILNKKNGHFTKADLGLLNTIVDMAGMSIRNSLLHRDILQQRDYYSGIMESLNEGVVVVDKDLRIQDVNRYLLNFFNVNRNALQGLKLESAFSDPIFNGLRDRFISATDRRRRKKISFQRVFKNHENKPCHFVVSMVPFDIKGRSESSILVTFNDISRIERLHGYLKASATVAELLLKKENTDENPNENAQQVMEIMGRAAGACRSYCYVKPEEEKIDMVLKASWCADEQKTLEDEDIFNALLHEPACARWLSELSAGNIISGVVSEFPEIEERLLQHRDILSILMIPLIVKKKFEGFIGFDNCTSETPWHHAEISLLRSAADSLAKAFEYEIEQKERIQLQERLLHSRRMESMGEIASGISHNFRNILAGIMTNSQLIQMKYPDDTQLQRLSTGISNLSRNGSELIGHLMHFARKGPKREKCLFDLSEILEETSHIISTSFDKKIRIRKNCENPLPIKGDRAELSQVFMNLCTNARDAMPEGGVLDISAAGQNNRIVITLADTGIGIPPEILKRIFDPFFTTKHPDQGTGLGLSTAYGIVKDHDGEITVKSQPGTGTSFTLEFPMPEAQAPDPGKPKKHVIKGNGENVLVVDDESLFLQTTEELLRFIGYNTISADSGQKALEVYEREKPDMVMMDRNMPGIDGITAAKYIFDIDPSARIIIVSGYDEEGPDGIDDTVKSLICAYINKPFDIEQVSRVLFDIKTRRQDADERP